VKPFRISNFGFRDWLTAVLVVTLTYSVLLAPFAAGAQQPPLPVIGYLKTAGLSKSDAAFLQGLSETGYSEGRNVIIERRSAEGHYEWLPALASELVGRHVAVIVTGGGNAPALAAKAATSTIPIVFLSGGDPVRAGLVASLNRPGGNITGVTYIFSTLTPKRLELLHQLVPRAVVISALVNPSYQEADLQMQELREAAAAMRLQIQIVKAGTPADIDTAFTRLAQHRAKALFVANDPFLLSRSDQIAALAARHAIPAIYWERESVAAGGLMSYGPNLTDAYRRGGIYTGRILRGAKPADLPVEQPTQFELVINLKAAKALGLKIPQSLLVRADEVIQ
jgi:putative ABC transport system substrate-binding protein